MLSKEEKKAIDKMNKFARVHQDMSVVSAKDMDIVSKLVEKQQKLLEQKDNKINKVIEYIKDNAYDMHDGTFVGMTKDEVEKILKILED